MIDYDQIIERQRSVVPEHGTRNWEPVPGQIRRLNKNRKRPSDSIGRSGARGRDRATSQGLAAAAAVINCNTTGLILTAQTCALPQCKGPGTTNEGDELDEVRALHQWTVSCNIRSKSTRRQCSALPPRINSLWHRNLKPWLDFERCVFYRPDRNLRDSTPAASDRPCCPSTDRGCNVKERCEPPRSAFAPTPTPTVADASTPP